MAGAGKRSNGRGRGDTPPQQLAPAAFDGPNDPRGRTPSQSGRGSSRPGSQTRTASANRSQGQVGQTIRQDPARDPKPQILLKNVELGGNAYNLLHDRVSLFLTERLSQHFFFCVVGLRHFTPCFQVTLPQ